MNLIFIYSIKLEKENGLKKTLAEMNSYFDFNQITIKRTREFLVYFLFSSFILYYKLLYKLMY